MNILLLGGRGWIGSHLGPVLASRGHHVASVGLEDGDLTCRGMASILVEGHGPDLVVMLAAQPGRVFGENDPSHTVITNTIATINVAQACAEIGTRLCYVSTSEVYSAGSFTKTSSLDGGRLCEGMHEAPKNLYAASKLWAEQACLLYAPDDLLIIRPTMPYGPTMVTGYGRAALPTMVDNLIHGDPFTVHRDTYRSWCYIDDVVRGMADVIERGEGVYNVGRDDDLRSMESIAQLVCELLDADHRLVITGTHDETITPVKDISCARLRSLGWEPAVDLEDGIVRVAESLRGDRV